jgi:hypothetical protein
VWCAVVWCGVAWCVARALPVRCPCVARALQQYINSGMTTTYSPRQSVCCVVCGVRVFAICGKVCDFDPKIKQNGVNGVNFSPKSLSAPKIAQNRSKSLKNLF